jgi:hypothetical protein
MAALEALVGGLTPADEDVEFLQQTGIIPSPEEKNGTSTTTLPYTAGEGPTNLSTGSTDTGVLQAIQKLDEKMAGGFAQIMAKLSNTPMKGGQINSPQNIDMSTTTQEQTSIFNKIQGEFRKGLNNVTSGVQGMVGSQSPPPSNNGAAAGVQGMVGSQSPPPSNNGAAAGPTSTLSGGRRRTRKSRRVRGRSSRGRRNGRRRH